MFWRALLFWLGIFAMVGIPIFYVTSDYGRKDMESRLSEKLGTDIRIGSLHPSLFPRPALKINALVVHPLSLRGSVALDSIECIPSLNSLMDNGLLISSCQFRDLHIIRQTSQKSRSITLPSGQFWIAPSSNELVISDYRIHAFEGNLRGSIRLELDRNRNIQGISGTLTATKVQLEPLLDFAYGKSLITGTFTGKFLIDSASTRKGDAVGDMIVDGPLTIRNGTLRHHDHAPIAFNEASMQVHQHQGEVQITHLKMDARRFSLQGHVTLHKNRQLDGMVYASTGFGLAGSSMLLKGTLDRPKFVPVPLSLAGEIIGTATGGPLGGAIGSKVGLVIGALLRALTSPETNQP